jgi:surface protein
MFSFCSSLINLDLSNFNTQNAYFMEYMFYNCSSLESLNLINFKTDNIPNASHYCNNKDFSCMFYGCKALKGNIITEDNKIKEIIGKLNY